MRSLPFATAAAAALLAAPLTPTLAAQQRPLTFMDVQEMRRAGAWTPSPDGAWMLYTVTTPDWEAAESQTDIHLVSLSEGAASARRSPSPRTRTRRVRPGRRTGRSSSSRPIVTETRPSST